jgi:hypothetical protein
MEWLWFLGMAVVILGAAWLLGRYLKKLQDTADRRYPESPDDRWLSGGGGGV